MFQVNLSSWSFTVPQTLQTCTILLFHQVRKLFLSVNNRAFGSHFGTSMIHRHSSIRKSF
jgi:hypothetical protein